MFYCLRFTYLFGEAGSGVGGRRVGQENRERQNPKQAPLSARTLKQGLSRSSKIMTWAKLRVWHNPLSQPGAPGPRDFDDNFDTVNKWSMRFSQVKGFLLWKTCTTVFLDQYYSHKTDCERVHLSHFSNEYA